ncbi:hypothetical protein K438DRAFT_1868142 [Mycena galopus ATCC 62051]|nr:hypothetical protein K438DRAFT_1868142 [Mycena galopus ATCC 62051]
MFATSIWVPHLLTLTTTPNFLNLKISTQLTWMPEREKRSPVPPVPSGTPPARRLAQAKYCEKDISSWKLGRYRASIKADPEHVQEQKDRQKCADKAYREKNQNLLAFKKREKRKEANAQKGTKQEIMLWNMHFGPTENRTSSRKRFLMLCGGTKTGM